MDSNLLIILIVGIFVGGIAGYLGSLVISKRMALVGDALSHVALPGMGLALLLGFDVSLGAFAFLILGVILIWLLELRTSLPLEALSGVIFVLSLAIGFLIIPNPELVEALFGNIADISFTTAIISIVLSIIVFLTTKKIYRGMVLANVSEDLAQTQGVKTRKQNLIYLLLIAAIVALGVKAVGSLLAGALIIVPAATARNISKNLKEYILWSIVFGISSCIVGIMVFWITGLPAGPMIVLSSSLFFLISMLFKR